MSDRKCTNPKDSIATNKLPLHLVSPIVKAYQAIAHFLGNVKYGAWNYRAAGARASIYRSALDRHVDAWWEGEEIDPVDGTPHLANALCCLNILIEAKHSGGLIDDRPPSRSPELAKLRASFEALMPQIRARYADKNPHHYTIADTPAQAVEEPAANDEGWTRWHGCGFPPVEPERMVTVRRYDGGEARGPAGWFVWEGYDPSANAARSVMAYKVDAA